MKTPEPDSEATGRHRQTTIGRRRERLPGALRAPTEAERQWFRQMSVVRTRVPKGVFRYRSMAEANADWERWNAELVAAIADPNVTRPLD